VGEVIHGDYSARVRDARFDSVTQYELWKAIWSALNDNNFHELDWALQRHNDFLDSFAPMTFIGNHDVTRIASRLDDQRHVPHALVILMTVGGVPSIYAGDEYGFRGIKEERFGGDDAVRPEFPAAPSPLGERETEQFRLHQFLIGLRRRHPWLNRATTTAALLTNRQYVYVSRHGDDALLVALNLDETPLLFSLRDKGFQGGRVLGGDAAPEQADVKDLVVGPHGWLVLRLVS
jgi:glycosidase